MPGMREYDQDYVDACRSRVETQVAVFREVAHAARDHGDADISRLEGALESLEYEYVNNLVLVLEGYFADRVPAGGLPAPSGSAHTEVRLVCRSLTDNGGTLLEDPALPLDPQRSVLRLQPGDPVRLTLAQFVRLSDAYFRETESRLSRRGRD